MVGNAEDPSVRTGVTVVTAEKPFTAAVHVMGGAPGTRETDLLDPDRTVETVDALFLAGGSSFGLDAGSGVQLALRAQGRGFRIGPAIVPLAPGAIIFDLLNGGDKDWGNEPPYRALGRQAFEQATTASPALGSSGAGYGATTALLKGGLGSASQVSQSGHMVGALAIVNAVGSPIVGEGPHFWAAPFEIDGEFGGLGFPSGTSAAGLDYRNKLDPPREGASTTIAVIATDARLSKAAARRLAIMAHDGFARALWPCHTPMDGDLVFAAATGSKPLDDPGVDMMHLGTAAASAMARAIARGVYEAAPIDGDTLPAWKTRFAT